MNREQAKAVAPYVKAFGDGEDVQIDHAMDGWTTKEEMSFTGEPETYRIKPKPREFWANTKSRVIMPVETIHDRVAGDSKDIIKVREVLS